MATFGCAGGAGLALLAATRTWTVEVVQRVAPLSPTTVSESGGSLDALLPALALVGLASAGAILATRSWARAGIGVLAAVSGVGVAVSALSVGTHHPGVIVGWVIGAVLGGLLVAVSGIGTLLWGRGWPAMGSRYDSPGGRINDGRGPISRGDVRTGVGVGTRADGGPDAWLGVSAHAPGQATGAAGATRRGIDDTGTGEAAPWLQTEQSRRAAPSHQLWDAIDRGEDPTV
jgi:hypothetical protein